MSLPDTYEKVKLAVAAIALVEERDTEVDFRIFGTGFCVDPSGVVVTARHVIRDYYREILKAPLPHSHLEAKTPIRKPSFSVVFFRKGIDKFEALYTEVINFILPFEGDHPEDDVAVLRIPKCPEFWGTGYPHLELGDLSSARPGEEVAIAGYPLRFDLTDSRSVDLNRGIIGRIDEKIGDDKRWQITKLVLDITANPGNSGGPVFETDFGGVLGLVSAERPRDLPKAPTKFKGLFQIPAGLVYCIPSAVVAKAISALESAEKRA